MMLIYTWQLAAVLMLTFGLGFGLGRTYGECRAWEKMEREEKEQEDDNTL